MSGQVPVHVPRENVNDDMVTIVRWLAADGAAVESGQVIAEVETSKTNMDIEAPADGFLRYTYAEGDDVAVGAVLCFVTETADEVMPAMADAPEAPAAVAPTVEPKRTAAPVEAFRDNGETVSKTTRFSRKALAILDEQGIDPAQFAGRGLVRADDVLREIGERPAEAPVPERAEPPAVTAVIGATGVPVRREPLPRQKRTESKYLAGGYRNTIASGVTVSCATRGLRRLAQGEDTIRGNATVLFIHETARLLRTYPRLNAYHDNGEAVLYDEVNIGFAVDGDHGLKVPVIRNADTKDLARIGEEVEDLVLRYVEDNLDVEHLSGGTFTITDLSGEGAGTLHPIINQGQAAILGIGAEVIAPGQAAATYNLVLTFDHQLTEGRAAARFLGELRDRIAGYEASFVQQQGVRELACSVCMTPLGQLAPRNYLLQRYDPKGRVVPICALCAQGF